MLIAPQNFSEIEKQLRVLGVDRVYVHLYELLESIYAIKEDYRVIG